MPGIHDFEPLWKYWYCDEVIGTGSFGTVWKAHRTNHYGMSVQQAAIKHISIPNEAMAEDFGGYSTDQQKQLYATQLNRLIREVEAMIALRGKPHIVTYEEHKIEDKPDGRGYDFFLRMEMLTSLSEHVKHHGMDREGVVKLAIHMCKALQVLENHRYIHRDIKPLNIFVDADGDFKLGDFGMARVLGESGIATTNTGTPGYMAPEVYAADPIYDQTVDIYSLGMVLYYFMNRSRLPFESQSRKDNEALRMRMNNEPIPAPVDADSELSRIILKCCSFRPSDRYQNAFDLQRDLEAYRYSIRRSEHRSPEHEHSFDPVTPDVKPAVKPVEPSVQPGPQKGLESRVVRVPQRSVELPVVRVQQPVRDQTGKDPGPVSKTPVVPVQPPKPEIPPYIPPQPDTKTETPANEKKSGGARKIVLTLLAILIVLLIAFIGVKAFAADASGDGLPGMASAALSVDQIHEYASAD